MARTKAQVKKVGAKRGAKAPRYGKHEPVSRKSAPLTGGVKKPHRYKPGTVALRQIRKYQKNVDLLLRKLPFQRFIRDIAVPINPDLRWQKQALMAMQEAFEAHAVDILTDSGLLAIFTKRVTVMPRDVDMIALFRREQYL